MRSIVAKSYGWLHSTLVEGVRRLPISSKAFGPPKGIIPDIRNWVDEYKAAHPSAECWYRKIHEAVEVRYPPAHRLEELPAIFLEDQQVQQPEVYLASIPEARILSESGVIISPDDRAFEQSCCWKSFFFTQDVEYNTLRRMLKPTKLPGGYITLISRHASSYYHWFTECLPRLYLRDSLPPVPILLQDGLRDWQLESLALLGIANERLVQLPKGCYEVDQLYFPSFPAYATFTNDWTFACAARPLAWLREEFCGKQQLNKDKRVYISREGVAHRRVLNEEPLMRALEREGFLIVDTSRLSIAEKINVFGDAALIVGVHGAGLTHSLFAPSGANLVEVLDPAKVVSTYYQIASALGQTYWYLFAENQAASALPNDYHVNPRWPFQVGADSGTGSRKGYDDLTIPIDILLRTIAAVAANAASPEQWQVTG